MSVPTRTTNW